MLQRGMKKMIQRKREEDGGKTKRKRKQWKGSRSNALIPSYETPEHDTNPFEEISKPPPLLPSSIGLWTGVIVNGA